MSRKFSRDTLPLLALLISAAHGQSLQVSVSPAVVEAGAPELIRVDAPTAESVEGEWLGHKVRFFRQRSGEWVALAGVDVEAPIGPSALHLTAQEQGGNTLQSVHVDIHAAHYRT